MGGKGTDRKRILERLAEIERLIAEIRDALADGGVADEQSTLLINATLAESDRETIDRVFEEMGIPKISSTDVEALREQLIEEGINPDENEFSRGIIAMREE